MMGLDFREGIYFRYSRTKLNRLTMDPPKFVSFLSGASLANREFFNHPESPIFENFFLDKLNSFPVLNLSGILRGFFWLIHFCFKFKKATDCRGCLVLLFAVLQEKDQRLYFGAKIIRKNNKFILDWKFGKAMKKYIKWSNGRWVLSTLMVYIFDGNIGNISDLGKPLNAPRCADRNLGNQLLSSLHHWDLPIFLHYFGFIAWNTGEWKLRIKGFLMQKSLGGSFSVCMLGGTKKGWVVSLLSQRIMTK